MMESQHDPVADLLAEFLDADKRGENPDAAAFLDRCPTERREELRESLAFVRKTSRSKLSPPSRFGDFEILREIGRGGMGIVYEARQSSLNRTVALKLLAPWVAGSETALHRFEREAQAVAKLRHPNIVTLFSAGEEGGIRYLAMDLIPGQGLDEILRQAKESGALIPIPKLLRWGAQIARALECAHAADLIHRDVKPSNIRITPDERALLLDFGLARGALALTMSRSGDFRGTPMYCSPEQVAARRTTIDARTDVYSLGTTLYEAIAGRTPFEGDTAEQIFNQILTKDPPDLGRSRRGVSRDVEAVVRKAMEKEPPRRYATARAFAEDLEAVLEFRPVRARPLGPFGRRWRLLKSERMLRPILFFGFAVGVYTAIQSVRYFVEARWEFRKAEEYSAAGDYEESLSTLDRILGKDPSFSDALRLRGEVAEKKRALEEARLRKERDEKARALEEKKLALEAERSARIRGEGLRLTAQSAAVLPENPGLALLLAIEGAKRSPGLLANNTLIESLRKVREIKTLLGHEGRVRAAEYSPDGRLILTASDDGTARIWEGAQGVELRALRDSEGPVSRATFTPDGRRILTLSEKGSARIWEADSGREEFHYGPDVEVAKLGRQGHLLLLFKARNELLIVDLRDGSRVSELRGHSDEVLSAGFDAEGKRVVTSSKDGTVRVWEAPSGKEVARVDEIGPEIASAKLSPDGRRILILLREGTAVCWDLATSQESWSFKGRQGGGSPPLGSFSPDGKRVAIVFGSDTYVLESSDGETLFSYWYPGSGPDPRSPAIFSPDGRHIMTQISDKFIRVCSAADGKEAFILKGHEYDISSAVFSPDGRRVLTASRDGSARIWDLREGRGTVEFSHESRIAPTLFSPDGRKVLAGSNWNRAHVFDSEDGEELACLEHSAAPVSSLDLSPDGKRLVTALSFPSSRSAYLWNLETGTKEAELTSASSSIYFARFSPRGDKILTISSDMTGQVWDADSGKMLAELKGHEGGIQYGLFSADGRKILTAPLPSGYGLGDGDGNVLWGDGTARVWDASSGRELIRLDGVSGWYDGTYACFSPDGRKIAAVSEDEDAARIWDADTGKELRVLRGHSSWLDTVSFDPSGRRLVTTSYDRTARIWDVETGAELVVLSGHEDALLGAVFSPDGRLVVTASQDGTARLWDAEKGGEIMTLRSKEGFFWTASFSPDGRRILTDSKNEAAISWPVDPLSEALRHKPRDLTPNERRRFEIPADPQEPLRR